jgi:hypothetical protein
VTEQFNWHIEPAIQGAGNPSTITIAPNGTDIIFVWASDRDPSVSYTIFSDADQFDMATNHNKLPGGSSIAVDCPTAISVGSTGAGPFTFSQQPFASQFSTFAWGGGAGDNTTLAAFDAAVQMLDATAITTALAPAAGNPPAAGGMARWASAGGYLLTRPTGTRGDVILAHLRNDSGMDRTVLQVSYDYTNQIPVAEEILGHAVYYSLSGAPNSWTQIPELTNDRTTGAKLGNVNLSGTPWTVGSFLYILWADDNGSGSPDDANEIDNLSFSFTGPPPPTVTDPTPSTLTVSEGHSFSFSVTVTGGPTIQWYKGTPPGGTAIPGATATTYAKVATPADAGTYYVVVQNPSGTATSGTAALTVLPVIVPYNHNWRYETNSQDATLAGGTPWYAPAFDDTGWLTGDGLLGLETTGATLALLPTPINTPLPVNTNQTAYYLRTSINVPAVPAGQTLVLCHIIDDGAILYVDGVEALRYNMTNPPPVYSTNLASAQPPGGDANIVCVPVSLSPGIHSVAVEVHQNSRTSSDVLFGAELRTITRATLTISHPTPTTVQLDWTASPSWILVEGPTVTGPFTPVAGNPQGTYTTAVAGNQFFLLRFTGRP